MALRSIICVDDVDVITLSKLNKIKENELFKDNDIIDSICDNIVNLSKTKDMNHKGYQCDKFILINYLEVIIHDKMKWCFDILRTCTVNNTHLQLYLINVFIIISLN